MKYKKELGQHFLVDKKVIGEILKASGASKKDLVIEVGAGTGALTKPLAKKVKKVIAVEIDRELVPRLESNLKGVKNVEIVNNDILSFLERENFFQQLPKTLSLKVIGAIPYQISSPLIHKLLKMERKPILVTIVVQKEMAERIVAKAPKATYLGSFVANFGESEILGTIGPEAFYPQPKVDSSILKIILYSKELVADPGFEEFLHRGFSQPRKMLNKSFPAEVLKKTKIDPQIRTQTLSFDDWRKLFQNAKEVI